MTATTRSLESWKGKMSLGVISGKYDVVQRHKLYSRWKSFAINLAVFYELKASIILLIMCFTPLRDNSTIIEANSQQDLIFY